VENTNRSILQKIGARIEQTGPQDPAVASQRILGERRLQTWILTALSTLVASVCASIIYVFAGVPGGLHELKNSVDDLKIQIAGAYKANQARQDIAQLTRRIDRVDVKDVADDNRLNALERNQAVLTVRVGAVERKMRMKAAAQR
jgi:hypothetical protein